MIEDIVKRVDSLIERLKTEKVKQSAWESERRKLLIKVDQKKDISGILLQVVELFKEIGGNTEAQVLEQLQDFVSYGLNVVFGQEYRFVTTMGKEGKDLKVDFHVETSGLRSKVIGAKGGGVAEVVSILSQIFFVLLDKRLAKFLVLDAALIHLSEKYWKNMSQLLSEICDKTDIQILLLAHVGDYGAYADSLYRFTQEKGRTKAEKLK